MGGLEDPAQDRVGHRVGQVVAHVATLENRAIYGISLAVGEAGIPIHGPAGVRGSRRAQVDPQAGEIRAAYRDKWPHRWRVSCCPMVGTTWRPRCALGLLRLWLALPFSDRFAACGDDSGPAAACGEEVKTYDCATSTVSYANTVEPLATEYCIDCHTSEKTTLRAAAQGPARPQLRHRGRLDASPVPTA